MKKKYFALVILFAAALFVPYYVMAQGADVFRQEGIASWYGKEFEGRPTASGEIYDSSQLTAAHPNLPFGTMVTVTNKHNDKKVTVRINDRGPFVAARIIDVSRAAAQQLDMIVTGTAPVSVESVERITFTPPAPPAPPLPVLESPPFSAPIPVVQAPVQQQPVQQPPLQPQQYGAPEQPPAPQAPVYTPVPPAQAPVPQAPPAAQPTIVYVPIPAPAQAPAPNPYQAPVTQAPVTNAAPNPYSAPVVNASPVPQQAPAANSAPPPVYSNYSAKLTPEITVAPNKSYRLQVGSYKVARNAVDAFERLKNAGLNPAYERYTDSSSEYFRVVLSSVRGTDVQLTAERLGAAGFREALIREER